MALVGNGQVYSVELKHGEQYIAHPRYANILLALTRASLTRLSNVVAYSMSSNPPRPYRFKSTTLNFQVPGLKTLPRLLQSNKFIRDISNSNAWKTTMRILHAVRTWARMTIWGDRVRCCL